MTKQWAGLAITVGAIVAACGGATRTDSNGGRNAEAESRLPIFQGR